MKLFIYSLTTCLLMFEAPVRAQGIVFEEDTEVVADEDRRIAEEALSAPKIPSSPLLDRTIGKGGLKELIMSLSNKEEREKYEKQKKIDAALRKLQGQPERPEVDENDDKWGDLTIQVPEWVKTNREMERQKELEAKLVTIKLVLNNGKEKPIKHEAVFEYTGVVQRRETETGYLPEKKLSWFGASEIQCEVVAGKLESYQFAVFADDGCKYESENNKCRLIHGRHDVETGETSYSAVDNAVIGIRRSSRDYMKGVVATQALLNQVSGENELINILPSKLKAVYFCDPNEFEEEFEINFEDSALVALIKSSPVRPRAKTVHPPKPRSEVNRPESTESPETNSFESSSEESSSEKKWFHETWRVVSIIVMLVLVAGYYLIKWKLGKKPYDSERERVKSSSKNARQGKASSHSYSESYGYGTTVTKGSNSNSERAIELSRNSFGTKERAMKTLGFDISQLLSPYLSEEEFKKKYRFLVRSYSPDKHPNDTHTATAKMQEVNEAAEIIKKHFRSIGEWK